MNNIKEIIKDRGLQLYWVAKRIKAHPSHLSMWISEKRYPSHERLISMTKVLRCKVKDLYPNAKVKCTYILEEE